MEVETSFNQMANVSSDKTEAATTQHSDVSLAPSLNKVLQPLNSNENTTQATSVNIKSKINKPSTNIRPNNTLKNQITAVRSQAHVSGSSSPNKSYLVPIAAKPVIPNSAGNWTLPTTAANIKPNQPQSIQNQKSQSNFISGAQLQQQQQQYIMQQHIQQQIANLQRNFQSQQQVSENQQNSKYQQQQQQNQQKMTQQLAKLLKSQSNSEVSEKTAKPIQPKKAPLAPKPAISSNPNPFVGEQNQQNPTTKSSNVPTIFTATTNANGQLIFKTVEPSSATAAAIAAYQRQQLQHQQQQNQQQQINIVQPSKSFYNNNNTMVSSVTEAPSQSMDKTSGESSKNLNFEMSMQEMLKQRLLQEELKFQKLQQKLDLLASRAAPTENLLKKIPNKGDEKVSPGCDMVLKKMMHDELRMISSKCLSTEKSRVSSLSNDSNPDNRNQHQQHHNFNQISTDPEYPKAKGSSFSSRSSSLSKRRGRPRLYEVHPVTGKSMKARPLNLKTNTEIIFQANINNNLNVSSSMPNQERPSSNVGAFLTGIQQENPIDIIQKEDEETIDIDLNNEYEDSSSNHSYSAESENNISDSISDHLTTNRADPGCLIIEDNGNENNHKNKNSNSCIKQIKETESSVNKILTADKTPQKNHQEIFTNNPKPRDSPTSPYSSYDSYSSGQSSRLTSRSSSNSSRASLNESARKRMANEMLELARSTNSIPLGNENVIITHVIEGHVIKESSRPFDVKSQSAGEETRAEGKKAEISIEERKLYMERIYASRKKMKENLERACEASESRGSSAGSRSVSSVESSSGNSGSPEFFCIECKSTHSQETNTQNTKKYCTKKFCSLKCMEKNVENLQLMWAENNRNNMTISTPTTTNNNNKNSSNTNASPKMSINSNKKFRSSAEYERHNGAEQQQQLKKIVSPQLPSLKSPKLAYQLNLQNNPVIYKVPNSMLQSDSERVELSQSVETPQMASLAISLSPKNQMNHVVNHLNVSKATFEAELPQGDPSEWNCDQVYQFVKLVAGMAVAELFLAQEVDGSALSLIRDDHLVNTMGIKLGPALKIMNKFNEVKNRF